MRWIELRADAALELEAPWTWSYLLDLGPVHGDMSVRKLERGTWPDPTAGWNAAQGSYVGIVQGDRIANEDPVVPRVAINPCLSCRSGEAESHIAGAERCG